MKNFDWLQPDYSQFGLFILLCAALFVLVMGRFVLIAGAFYLYFYLWQPERWKAHRLSQKPQEKTQLWTELGWSMLTALIFAFAGSLTVVAYQKGYTAIYQDISSNDWWYLPLSLMISMLIHETYYYWLHRWMHNPLVFKYVHQVHHASVTTSPWTAFSFHPIEGFLEAIIFPAIVFLLPLHTSVILIQLTIMTFSAVINHLGIEIYPKNKAGNFLGQFVIGATHHSLHHKQYKFNFGLYFTFWDKWSQTESPLFKKHFEERK